MTQYKGESNDLPSEIRMAIKRINRERVATKRILTKSEIAEKFGIDEDSFIVKG